jgi:V/A-type H+-transporting ATPase subunit K
MGNYERVHEEVMLFDLVMKAGGESSMWGLAILCGFVATLVGSGYWMAKKGYAPLRPKMGLTWVMVLAFLVVALSVGTVFAAESGSGAPASESLGLGLIGAALATGLACIGAGIGVAFVGAAALGVVGEKPALFGTTLIYIGLAEGIAIYGIVISLFILNRI